MMDDKNNKNRFWVLGSGGWEEQQKQRNGCAEARRRGKSRETDVMRQAGMPVLQI